VRSPRLHPLTTTRPTAPDHTTIRVRRIATACLARCRLDRVGAANPPLPLASDLSRKPSRADDTTSGETATAAN
jgi:hypothetical protein